MFEAVPFVFWLKVGQVKVPVLKFPEAGVPSAGVIRVGLFARTTEPVPVPVIVPPRVKFPVLVTVPLRVRPLTVPVPPTDVTPEITEVDTLTKSEPFHAQSAFSPATIVTPVVGPTPRRTIDCVPLALMTMYALLWAGAVMFRVVVPAAVQRIIAALAWFAASSVVVSVTSESTERVVVPAIAVSRRDVIALLTVSPQTPVKEPVVGRAKPRSGVAMKIP
jgi:hypothetical protein